MKGTIDQSSLCDRCRSGFVAQNTAGHRLVFCRSIGRPVFPDVRICNGYVPIGSTGFWMNGFGGEAHVSEATVLDPRPRPGQHL